MSSSWYQLYKAQRDATRLSALPDPPCEFCGGDLTSDGRSGTRCARCGQVPVHEDTVHVVAGNRLESERPGRIPRAFAEAEPPLTGGGAIGD